MSEQDLTRAIIQALTAKRVWCWRNNAGGTTVSDPKYGRRFIRMAPAGSPDIMGVIGHGHLFGIEVKFGKGKQSPAQIAWQAKATVKGVYYDVARSVSEALGMVAAWEQVEREMTASTAAIERRPLTSGKTRSIVERQP